MNPIFTLIRRVRAIFTTVSENDSTFNLGLMAVNNLNRDRFPVDRQEVLQQSIEAWRVNPLARRIVGLVSQYVVGGGIEFTCKPSGVSKFLHAFWNHRLNRIPIRAYEWCDELTRTGNLFILLSTDTAGMSYVRAIPASQIERIEAQANDIEQPVAFYPRPTLEDPDPKPWRAYDENGDDPAQTVMLHYAINRPVGAQWGESDLAPLLRWLSRYANWLEDRARLNHFRSAFLYVVKGRFTSDAARTERQRQLNASPPTPGSILVCDEGETWDIISPKLEASDANTDGQALKKMVCSGAGIPMHFLAEPEGSTRTTAESAGGPTFRHFEQRQQYFLWMLTDLLQVVLNRRCLFDRHLARSVVFQVSGNDISSRDNAAMALAANNIFSAFSQARDRGLIDDAELLRLLYRFCGETMDVQEMLARGKTAPTGKVGDETDEKPEPGSRPHPDSNAEYIDRETGEAIGISAV